MSRLARARHGFVHNAASTPPMGLTAGTRLGSYEVLSPIGAGGMGEVYRARDTKLNRDVALKILPELFTSDPDRLARFQREAQVLASLNHPNIGHIYGFEDSGATHALVMELVGCVPRRPADARRDSPARRSRAQLRLRVHVVGTHVRAYD